MYPNSFPNAPAISGGYVPYFYQRGLHYLYALPSREGPRQMHESYPSAYQSSRTDYPFRDSWQPQTVEQIISQGYFSVPGADPVTAIISDKQHTSRLGLDDVIGQIRQRYEICHRNLYEIELAKCGAMNAIYRHEAYVGPPNSRQMYAKHKAIQDLYEQERTTLWKEISRLRTQMPESAQAYLSAHRKVSVLTQEPGDGP
jgi:hypothetical protein